jgi:glucose uptake protein
MFIVDDIGLAIVFCVITMLGWGSWANTLKLAGKDKWQFPLYYWDYAIGVFALSIVMMATLGVSGTAGMSSFANLSQAEAGPILRAFLSGVLFNVSNILLVVAIDAAGMSVAFPVGVGLALVIGTVASYLQSPKGDGRLLFAGVALIVCAMCLSAVAYSKLPPRGKSGWSRGVVFAVIAGCLMGFFYPELSKSISPDFGRGTIRGGYLTPYTALFLFGAGLLVSNVVVNTIFMRAAGLIYTDYLRGTLKLHSLGFLGGLIWMLALTLNVIASGVAGPAISYALGQGATLVAAIWGVFIWHEFRSAPSGVEKYIAIMFVGYASGLALIGMATL